MLLQDEVHLLRGIPLFASIETMRLKLLAFACDRVTFAAGSVLFQQGDAADATYVILSGQADILQSAGKAEASIGTAGPRSVVGESALVSDRPRTQTLRATTEVETLRISTDTFQKLLTCCPGSLEKVVQHLGDRMAKAG